MTKDIAGAHRQHDQRRHIGNAVARRAPGCHDQWPHRVSLSVETSSPTSTVLVFMVFVRAALVAHGVDASSFTAGRVFAG